MSDSPLIDSLAAAVQGRPDDLPLRLHLAELLVEAGRGAEAIGHAAQVLAREPGNAAAQRLMTVALGARPAAPPTSSSPGASSDVAPSPSPSSAPVSPAAADRPDSAAPSVPESADEVPPADSRESRASD